MSSIMALKVFKSKISFLENKIWYILDEKCKTYILNDLMMKHKIPYKFHKDNIKSAEGTIKYMGIVPCDFCFTSYYINQMRHHNYDLIREINILKRNIEHIVRKHGVLQN